MKIILEKYVENRIEYLKKYSNNYEEDLIKLKSGIPVQYIIGNVDFYNGNYIVNENVLIPRFETEMLVEIIMNYNLNNNLKVVDLGTGSGCIAIELSKKFYDVTGIDISNEALEVAHLNNIRNNANVNFILSDMLEVNLDSYDVIVSNPPYIKEGDLIDPLVDLNEPHLALYAKMDGLYYYYKIINKLVNLKNKYIFFEIGSDQKERLELMIKELLPHAKYQFLEDLTKRDRFLIINI